MKTSRVCPQKSGADFSNVWKIGSRFFQCLENRRRARLYLLLTACLLLSASATPAATSSWTLVDFGINTRLTASPDANGFYWNNVFTDSSTPPPGTPVLLTNVWGEATGVKMTVSGFGAGANANGTTVPDASLGWLSQTNATSDSFFVSPGSPGTVYLTGLVQSALYRVQLFGSRDAADTRVTRYTAIGATTASATLVTSGSGIGQAPQPDANRSTSTILENVQPSASGVLQISVAVESGSHGYLGAFFLARTGTVEGVTNQPPIASSVMIFGSPRVGTLFTGYYVYADADGDPEGTTLLQWQRTFDTNGPAEAIAGATNRTYSAGTADLGAYIRVAVTPIAAAGLLTGVTAYSAWRGPVAGSNALAVFHVGNSFTRWGDIPAQLQNMAAASDRPHVRGDHLTDGQTLEYQWSNGVPGGTYTRGSPVRWELATASWDALVLQPMSREWQAERLDAFLQAAGWFADLAESVNTRVYLYAYWPWRDDPLSDQDGINAAFEQVRSALSVSGRIVRIIPVGEAFRAAVGEMGTGELAGLTRGDLYRDELHPSDLGYYLSALVHFAVLHRRNPAGLPAQGISSDPASGEPVSIPTNVAAAFQRVAWDAARSIPESGITAARYAEWFKESGLPGSGDPADIPLGDQVPNLLRWAHGLSNEPLAEPNALLTIQVVSNERVEVRYPWGTDARDAGLRFQDQWSTNLALWTTNSPASLTDETDEFWRVLRVVPQEFPLAYRYRIQWQP